MGKTAKKPKSMLKKFILFIIICFALLSASLVILLNVLPGPKEIKTSIESPSYSPKSKPVIKKNTSKTIAQKPRDNSKQKPHTQKDDQGSRKARSQLSILMNILEDKAHLNVCENLREETAVNLKEKDGIIELNNDIFSKKYEHDPIIGAIRYPLKKIIQDEVISSLLKDIIDSEIKKENETEESSFLEKINFYTKAAKAAIRLKEQKKNYEILTDRAKHLQIIAMIAKIKPEMAYDSELLEDCHLLQQSVTTYENIDIKAERKKILSIIERSGLKAKDLHFDPKIFTEYKVNYSEKGLFLTTTTGSDPK